MAYRGRFQPKNPSKYSGDWKKIVWRSLWERKFCRFCDEKPHVLSWNSEDVIVPYVSPVDGKVHRYFIDFWIRIKDKDGTIKEHLIEIKPAKQCQPPKKLKKITPRYKKEVETYLVNQRKWEAAEEYAANRGMKFLVLTENHLGI